MLSIGDIHIYVTDITAALRFYGDGMALQVIEREISAHSGYATLESPDGGPALRLIGTVDPWPPDARPERGTRPAVGFDVTTTTFDETLVRLTEHGGTQVDEIEIYNELRVVAVADPDGNVFELIELPEDES